MATSEACCKLAPVTVDYTPKGKYERIAGINTYIVGPENATKGIIDIYDIFGIWHQTIQGADRLSAHTGFVVLVPDFFDGPGLDIDAVPMDTDEKKQKVNAFFGSTGNPQTNLEKLLVLRKALTEKFPAVEGNWGLFGLCWGGKLAVLACGEGNEGVGRRFSASGTAHPSMYCVVSWMRMTPRPRRLLISCWLPRMSLPTRLLCTRRLWVTKLNLKNEANVKEYERGYKQAADFFAKHL